MQRKPSTIGLFLWPTLSQLSSVQTKLLHKLLNQTGIFHSVVAMCNDIIPGFFWRNNLILVLFLLHCIL